MKQIIYAAYLRKSSEDDSRQILSIPAQKDELEKLASKQGLTISYWFEESKSAKDPGRPQFNHLMGLISEGKAQGIICWKLDRLARNTIDGGAIQHFMHREMLLEILTPERTYYSHDSTFMTAFEFANSTQFVRDLSVNVKRGLRKRLEMKRIPTGMAKFGYLNDKTKDKGDRDWIVDRKRLDEAREMLRMYQSGNYSVRDIYKWAIENGVTTPKYKRLGGKPIKLSQIYRILHEPLYAGFFYDKEERVELHDALPRLITEEEHLKILRMLGGRSNPRMQKHEATYSGFIFSPANEFIGPDIKLQVICECRYKFSCIGKKTCPKCGKGIHQIHNPKYLHYTYYRNINKKRRGESTKNIEENKVTEKLLVYLEDNLLLSPALSDWCKRHFEEIKDKEITRARVEKTSREERAKQLEQKKTKYQEMYADELITADELRIQTQKINQELLRLQAMTTESYDWLEKANDIVSIGSEMKLIFKEGTIKAKRSVLSKLGTNLIWDEENLSFINSKPVQVLIEGLNRIRKINPKFEPKTTLAEKDKTEVFASVCPNLLPR